MVGNCVDTCGHIIFHQQPLLWVVRGVCCRPARGRQRAALFVVSVYPAMNIAPVPWSTTIMLKSLSHKFIVECNILKERFNQYVTQKMCHVPTFVARAQGRIFKIHHVSYKNLSHICNRILLNDFVGFSKSFEIFVVYKMTEEWREITKSTKKYIF